jgi:hypothetical protein
MPHKPHRETPIERIYREVMGRKMALAVRRVLLRKRRPKRTGSSEPSLSACHAAGCFLRK